jgi:hypothetical protein
VKLRRLVVDNAIQDTLSHENTLSSKVGKEDLAWLDFPCAVVFASGFKVSSDPDDNSFRVAHSVLRVLVDNLLLCGIGDDVQDVGIDLSRVEEVSEVAVSTIVELLEVLIVHLVSDLR